MELWQKTSLTRDHPSFETAFWKLFIQFTSVPQLIWWMGGCGGPWGMIQQRTSSSLFLQEVIMSSSDMDMDILSLDVIHPAFILPCKWTPDGRLPHFYDHFGWFLGWSYRRGSMVAWFGFLLALWQTSQPIIDVVLVFRWCWTLTRPTAQWWCPCTRLCWQTARPTWLSRFRLWDSFWPSNSYFSVFSALNLWQT